MSIRIENAEFQGPQVKSITLDLHGRSCEDFIRRVEAGETFNRRLEDIYYTDPGILNICWDGMGVGMEQGEGFTRINVWRYCTAQGDDRLDGTVEPTELSLDDILAVAGAVKSLMGLLG